MMSKISDLSFRRHILVQVLIVMDFLLSLSAKAREKLAQSLPENTNKSVMYAELVLSEEDVSGTPLPFEALFAARPILPLPLTQAEPAHSLMSCRLDGPLT